MSDWVELTSLETVIDVLDEVVDTGFDEDVIGWGSSIRQLDRDELRRCIENDESFEAFVNAIKPNIREWLKRCFEEDARFSNE